MSSLLRSVGLLCSRLHAGFVPVVRSYATNYKPKDKQQFADALTKLSSKDMILFHYEAPRTIFWQNLLAMALLPVWVQIAVFSFGLSDKLRPLKTEDTQLPSWIQGNVDKSSKKIAVAFFIFGVSLSGYWLGRTMNTVRQLVLRKGGKHLTIVTYGLLGRSSKFTTIPLSHCSAHMYLRGRSRFFLRVKDRQFKFQVNVTDGVFTNRPLFERTVGISRRI